MKRYFYIIGAILLFSIGVFAESSVLDYKTKNTANEKERTYLLDLLRANLSNEFKQEFIFVVEHFKVSGDYAWFRGTAKRKDGKEISLSEDIPYDCCHVEALFKKNNGKWQISEWAAFSTDVWWDGIQARYPKAAKEIFQ
ncbi:hypothetical protein EHQ68_08925 [Leptospira congkakensis]|uniref:Uncharacterized protein n=1 Tax=Leptospira congkakensis TaxID=2484932 RepID=A0A4Z1AAX8_9LEPT|nr:hypothetical protein [Leptospira congkakensis]TGL88750.1 hypothetical protein EHQ69_14995 [Leptospira congkakensis]TGL89336.1 hypothetical protein EHQ68_08925 [Leptospira congkakensis]TGL97304.1 hypothetical protein EHQ70_08420 [Leptospira congkakensis]